MHGSPLGAIRYPVQGSRSSKPSLVAVLCTLLALDFGLRRALWPVLRSDRLMASGALRDVTDFTARFAFNAATVMGITLAVLGLARLLVRRSIVPRGAKAAVGALATAFLPLLMLAAWRPLPLVLAIYLQASFSCLLCLVMLGGVLAGGAPRARLALLLMALPAVLILPWVMATLNAARSDGALVSAGPRLAEWAGELAAVVAAAASLPLLLPRRPSLAVPALATGAVLATAGFVCFHEADLALRVASDGFGLDLPPSTPGRLLFLAALGAWAFASVALLVRPGPERLRGYGVVLIGLAGFRLDAPVHYAAAMVGMLCLVESIARELPSAMGDDAWRALVQRVAARLGAVEVAMAGTPGFETGRVVVTRDGETLEVSLGREAGTLRSAEVVVGHAPSQEAPPLSLQLRAAPRLGRARGDEVATGDVAFDQRFRTLDARSLSGRDRLLDDDLRPRLAEHVDGWLGVWPGAGARYRTHNPGTLEERLPAVADLLIELKKRD